MTCTRKVIEIRYDVEHSTAAFAFDCSDALSMSATNLALNEALVELIHLGTQWINRSNCDYEAVDRMVDTHGMATC